VQTIGESFHCEYCHEEIDPESDWQFIEKNRAAHTVCAFRVNDEFFAARDESEDDDAA